MWLQQTFCDYMYKALKLEKSRFCSITHSIQMSSESHLLKIFFRIFFPWTDKLMFPLGGSPTGGCLKTSSKRPVSQFLSALRSSTTTNKKGWSRSVKFQSMQTSL